MGDYFAVEKPDLKRDIVILVQKASIGCFCSVLYFSTFLMVNFQTSNLTITEMYRCTMMVHMLYNCSPGCVSAE